MYNTGLFQSIHTFSLVQAVFLSQECVQAVQALNPRQVALSPRQLGLVLPKQATFFPRKGVVWEV